MLRHQLWYSVLLPLLFVYPSNFGRLSISLFTSLTLSIRLMFPLYTRWYGFIHWWITGCTWDKFPLYFMFTWWLPIGWDWMGWLCWWLVAFPSTPPYHYITPLLVICFLVTLFLGVTGATVVVVTNIPNSDPLCNKPLLFQLLALALALSFLNHRYQVGFNHHVSLLGMLVFPIYLWLWYSLIFKILFIGFPFALSIAFHCK